MLCPICKKNDTTVKDSRPVDSKNAIKRRRYCSNCDYKFNTLEKVQIKELNVEKKNHDIVTFSRDKLFHSISIALRKRPFTQKEKEKIVDNIIHEIESHSFSMISTKEIGEIVINHLRDVDKVAYIRFASVYLDFNEINDFISFIQKI